MKLKIKTKVLLGILFLFVEFVAIGALSIYYISSIKYSSEMIIKNNYRSVHYSENMIQAIDETNTVINSLFLNNPNNYDKNSLGVSFNKFEGNLNLEEKNITEFGEKEIVQSIKEKYFNYKSFVTNQKIYSTNDKFNYYSLNILPLLNELRSKIFTVSTLNMQSILQKNETLNVRINHIYKILSIVLTMCFLITFSFMFNFPRYIAEPIKKITENIKDLTNKNFKGRIKISSDDEFKELAEAINFMAEKLEQNYQQVVTEKQATVDQKTLDSMVVLKNVQSLIGSVRILVSSISKTTNDETLEKQAEILKEIEIELSKTLKSR